MDLIVYHVVSTVSTLPRLSNDKYRYLQPSPQGDGVGHRNFTRPTLDRALYLTVIRCASVASNATISIHPEVGCRRTIPCIIEKTVK